MTLNSSFQNFIRQPLDLPKIFENQHFLWFFWSFS